MFVFLIYSGFVFATSLVGKGKERKGKERKGGLM